MAYWLAFKSSDRVHDTLLRLTSIQLTLNVKLTC